jgi:two-component system, NtrC family, sensor kinase
MFLEPILILILIRYLRKKLLTPKQLPQIDRLLLITMVTAIVLLVMGSTIRQSRPAVMWLNHALVFALVYWVLNKKEFRPVKSLIYSLLPLIIISFITSVTQAISKTFYREWNNVFSAASLFALIWILAMWLITKKQRKALEEERKKTLEIEKEIQVNEKIKAALEVQVIERTAALTLQKEELEKTLHELKDTQAQLIQSEKMASLGELTAGIAHEIQNPLNFVNNFSEVNSELIAEMKEELAKGNIEEAKTIAANIDENEQKIIFHGKRADSIVKGMLQHSRSSSGVKEPTDINALADEYLRLAYHGLRAKDKSFNATMKTDYDESLSADEAGIGKINIIPQDIGRVILNLITNAFYAVAEKKKQNGNDYEPTVTVSTSRSLSIGEGRGEVSISVTDNGNGIPQKILDKIFQPFFTTKPTGQGTGLGLSLSYDIVKAHGGELKVETLPAGQAGKEGVGTTFIIILPV